MFGDEPYAEATFASATEFLNAIRGSKWLYPEFGRAWIFRGHGLGHSWKLLPSAFRAIRDDDNSDIGVLLKYGHERAASKATVCDWPRWRDIGNPPPGFNPNRWHDQVTLAAPHAFAHAWLVREFVLIADQVKQPVRGPAFLWHLPNETFDSLARFIKGEVIDPTFAVAQHHGVPTPLLDWTYNPLVAAYFAAEQALRHDAPEPLVIWALSEDYLNEVGVSLARLTIEPHVTSYLDAQLGLFTYHPRAYCEMTASGFRPFDDLINENIVANTNLSFPVLRKLSLDAHAAEELFRLLWYERVSRAHLMPGFDSVAQTMALRARWSPPPPFRA